MTETPNVLNKHPVGICRYVFIGPLLYLYVRWPQKYCVVCLYVALRLHTCRVHVNEHILLSAEYINENVH